MAASTVTIKDANGVDRVIATELNGTTHTFRHVIVTDDGSLPYDSITETLNTIDFAHHEIHEGDMYCLELVDESMANNDYIGFSFTTPAAAAGRIHFTMSYSAKAAMHLELIEVPQTLTNGSAAVPLNCNRSSANASALVSVLSYDSTAGDVITQGTGTIVESFYTWAAKSVGSSGRSQNELILAASTSYAIKLTADANTNAGQIILRFYEHIDS